MRIAIAIMVMAAPGMLSGQGAPKINKVGVSPTSPASGKEMFHAYCASCHGVDAKGNGPAAAALKKPPSDLTALAKNSGGTFPALLVRSSIKDGTQAGHGSKDMPVWGPILSSVSGDNPGVVDQRISNLVGYVQSIQVK
ncbi:MAG TPA: cytochrome c [Verrucomicrobiae bacterium]|nr:cytochrome c [Verrucomicrobiae bacterium]